MEMERDSRGWLVYAFANERQYAGNDLYSDVLERLYLFDSNVPNSRNVHENDVLIISGRARVLGVARAEQIGSEPGTKAVYRCPECQITGIKKRKNSVPAFRCNDGHVFVEPIMDVVPVTQYIVDFGDSFIAVPPGLTRQQALEASDLPSAQLSIRRVDLQVIWPSLLSLSPRVSTLYPPKEHFEYLASSEGIDTEREVDSPYSPDDLDVRTFAMRMVQERRGQTNFRQSLRERYGDICLISGCTLLDVIEAAHISPYRGPKDQHPDNGILLRSDLHILFDLDLLGVHPNTLRVHLHPSIQALEYLQFADRRLLTESRFSPSLPALVSRWRVFQNRVLRDKTLAN